MKCFYKRGRSECTKPVISICSNCKTQEYYCKRHGRHHSLHTKHNILSILSLGLNYFKKEIKACIRNIATNTDAVISEIRRTSLNAIVQLKIVNKNVENIEELTLKPYNTNRITFLIEQARQINCEMSESPIETSEKLKTLLKDKEDIIENQNSQIENQNNQIENQKNQIENQKNQIENQKNHIENQNNQIENQKNLIEKQKNQIENQNNQIENQKNRIEKQINQIENQNNQIEIQNNQIENQKNLIEKQNNQIEKQNNQIEIQNNQIENQKKVNKKNKRKIQKSKIENLSSQVKALEENQIIKQSHQRTLSQPATTRHNLIQTHQEEMNKPDHLLSGSGTDKKVLTA